MDYELMQRLLGIASALFALGFMLVWTDPPAWGLSAITFDGPQHGGGVSTTFDPSNQNKSTTLSNANLTGTCGSFTGYGCAVRGTSPTTHGGTDKVLFLFQVGQTASDYLEMGVQTSTYVAALAGNVIGFDTTFGTASVGFDYGHGFISSNNSAPAGGGNIGSCANSGDYVALAIDFATGNTWGNCYDTGAWGGWNIASFSVGSSLPDSGTNPFVFSSLTSGTYFIGAGWVTMGRSATLITHSFPQTPPDATLFSPWN